ncbi:MULTISPECIES: LLM class flavin-dependent oxidoreductase [unclassified Mycobacterium]|uniref:LLM class flavin-dependent oxidoreductase n=1 Tax=unclassified Mycobacterium TaxID=2642494 RepID=UPI0029C616D1|nr:MULTISPECIES: LLM class flavin-dependent oxidoreductase [unclassified Mycobacterium]
MELGYFAMPLHPPGTPAADWLEHDLLQLEYLDQLGYTEAWIGEHFTLPWEPLAAPDLFIAAALQRTTSIRLGTGVACLPSHHPAQLAARIALLDHLARGRLNFGIGVSGYNESELWGLDWSTDEHRDKFHAVIDAVIQLWTDPKPGLYESPFFRFRVPEPQAPYRIEFHHRPFQNPYPPIAVAAMTPKSSSLVLAGQRGWIPMSFTIASVPVLQGSWQTYADAALAAGRTPERATWRIAREVFVGRTSAAAREEALHGSLAEGWRHHILTALPTLKVPMAALLGPDADVDPDDVDAVLEYLCDNLWIVGDADEVTEKINNLYDDVGGFGTLLTMAHEWDDAGAWRESVRLMAQEVQPHLRELASTGIAV